MKKIILKMVILMSIVFFSQNAMALCVQSNNKIGLLGMDGTDGRVYVEVSEHSNECSCNLFRFKTTETDTKMALSILMSARLSGKKVRIDASDVAQCDSALRVYIQPD